jgi:hypothetical protein
VAPKHALFAKSGTDLKIKPLLPGIRSMSGEKIQWYLASELRDRIRQSGVNIKVVDRHARKEYTVEPREFTGRLLHELPSARSAHGDAYLELYLAPPSSENRVSLFRHGTRVLADLGELEEFRKFPWNAGYLQGIVDAPFLNLTPGTRLGVIHDERYDALISALESVALKLGEFVGEQKRAEEEHASREILKSIQKAFHEALLALPAEEYGWFDVHAKSAIGARPRPGAEGYALTAAPGAEPAVEEREPDDSPQRRFFEFAGPLFSVRVSPASCVVPVNQSRTLRALARDRSRHAVEDGMMFRWELAEGNGTLENADGEIVTFHAPDEPGLLRLRVTATQGEITRSGEAMLTVTATLLPENAEPKESATSRQGLPGYTFQHAPGELWRSRYDTGQNVIVINNGHRDFVYAARARALKLRYIARLFAKELVLKNFPGYAPEQLLERLIELGLYTEENLR